MLKAPEEIRLTYCRLCENREMTNLGVVCRLKESPDFSNSECSEFEEDENEVERLIKIKNESSEEETVNHLSLVFWLIPFIIALGYWTYSFYSSNKLAENYRFTKATVYDVDKSFNIPYFWVPSTKVYFRYKIDSKVYEEKVKVDGVYQDYGGLVGGDFLLIFSPNSHSNCQILLNKPLSDKILFPDDGFSEPELKKYLKERR